MSREALLFKCNGCGDCCRNLRVAVTHRDLSRLCRALDVPAASLVAWLGPDDVDFRVEAASFVALPGGPRLMVLAQDQGACRQLRADGSCGAYAARPRDCRLYPFVLERGDDRRVTRLALFEPAGCGDQRSEPLSLGELEREDAERAAELEEYGSVVARWNRFAAHRARFRHRTHDQHDFFAYLRLSELPA